MMLEVRQLTAGPMRPDSDWKTHTDAVGGLASSAEMSRQLFER